MPTLIFTPRGAKGGQNLLLDIIGFWPFEKLKYEWPSIKFVQFFDAGLFGDWHGTIELDAGRAPGKYFVEVTGMTSGQQASASVEILDPSGQSSPVDTEIPAGQIVNYPVSINSLPSAIISGFTESGYLSALADNQKQQALRDPTFWLKNHPFLYDKYPQYFVDQSKPSTLENIEEAQDKEPQGKVGADRDTDATTTTEDEEKPTLQEQVENAGAKVVNFVTKNVVVIAVGFLFLIAILAFVTRKASRRRQIAELKG